MRRIAFFSLVIFGFIAVANGQPASGVKKAAKDPFVDSIQLIISNSAKGFIDHRYNETEGKGGTTYTTTLPSLGFDKRFVQTSAVNVFKRKDAVILPYYIATRGFNDASAANKFYDELKKKVSTLLKPFAQDSTNKTGFARNTSYQLTKPVKDSFVTVELILLSDPMTVIMRLFNSKGSVEKGNMKSPPVVVNKNKNHYTQLLPLMEALMEYSLDNFNAIKQNILAGQKWKPTYTSIVYFRDFSMAKVEYVTDNLWNQYTTDLYFKDYATAEKRFTELAAEIEKLQTAFPYQRFETRSKPLEKWWYYDRQRVDKNGKQFKNTLRLSLDKFEFGEGYYLTFEFRKSV